MRVSVKERSGRLCVSKSVCLFLRQERAEERKSKSSHTESMLSRSRYLGLLLPSLCPAGTNVKSKSPSRYKLAGTWLIHWGKTTHTSSSVCCCCFFALFLMPCPIKHSPCVSFGHQSTSYISHLQSQPIITYLPRRLVGLFKKSRKPYPNSLAIPNDRMLLCFFGIASKCRNVWARRTSS